jgi:hypothetical protein
MHIDRFGGYIGSIEFAWERVPAQLPRIGRTETGRFLSGFGWRLLWDKRG